MEQPPSTVQLLMKARGAILSACEEAGLDTANVNVVFKGGESGRVEAFVHGMGCVVFLPFISVLPP